jgi:predicted transcriptional regulator
MKGAKDHMSKRGWGTISIDILEASLAPQKKTRIMYKANLNYDRFDRYFADFIRKGFLVEVSDSDGKPEYKISERGKVFLGALRKAQDLAAGDDY